MDERLLEWIFDRRAKGLRVSRKLIIVKAKAMHDENYVIDPRMRDNFNASKRLSR